MALKARYTVEDSSSQLTAIASYDGEYEEVSFTVQVFATSPIEWITEPRIPMIPKTVGSVLVPVITTKKALDKRSFLLDKLWRELHIPNVHE